MEISLNEALDKIFEEEELDVKNLRGKSLTQKKFDIQRYENFVDILTGKKEFEGNIDGPEDVRAIIKAIRSVEKDLSSGKGKESSLRKRLSQYSSKANDVEKILDKKDAGSKLTDAEKSKVEDFADEVEDALFNETYMKTLFPDAEDKNWSNNIEGTIAIKYTSPQGKDYYGIVRPPTGVITWEGMTLKKDGATSNIRSVISKDSKVDLKSRIEEYDADSGKILRGTKRIKDLLDTKRFDIKDDSSSKTKIEKAFIDSGLETGARGYTKGINKALKDINFWKTVKSLF